MDVLRNRAIKRIRDAISTLSRDVLIDRGSMVPTPDSDSYIKLEEYEDNVYALGGSILARYVTSLCKNTDYQDESGPIEHLEESVEAQSFVESDCLHVLSQKLSKALPHMDNVNSILEAEECIRIDCDISELIRSKPCKRVLEFLSDFPLESTKCAAIALKDHGNNILRKTCIACLSVSPLLIESHINYISRHLTVSGDAMAVELQYLNCSQPWIIYWSLHSLKLLGVDIHPYRYRAVETLKCCWDYANGGFGGGKGQIGHLATTYASLCVLKMLDSLNEVNVQQMYSFLMKMKHPDGRFSIHLGGESDIRGIYCAIASAKVLGILTPELEANVPEYVAKCQTYEGGIAGEINLEAHAGYTYCGLATLALLNQLELIDAEKLYLWCLQRQTPQFGHQGRPHKLVDACYAFWIGTNIEILEKHLSVRHDGEDMKKILLNVYILAVSQLCGGFRDKPRKPPDLYHTCYALSSLYTIGLKNMEHCLGKEILGGINNETYDLLLNVFSTQ